MRVKDKTQATIDAYSEKLNYIRASYFQKLLTDSELIDAFKALGYGLHGAKIAANYLKNTGEEYRVQFKKDHPSFY